MKESRCRFFCQKEFAGNMVPLLRHIRLVEINLQEFEEFFRSIRILYESILLSEFLADAISDSYVTNFTHVRVALGGEHFIFPDDVLHRIQRAADSIAVQENFEPFFDSTFLLELKAIRFGSPGFSDFVGIGRVIAELRKFVTTATELIAKNSVRWTCS